MVVDMRKAEVLERKMAKLLDGVFDFDSAGLYLCQQLFYLLGVNVSPAFILSFNY